MKGLMKKTMKVFYLYLAHMCNREFRRKSFNHDDTGSLQCSLRAGAHQEAIAADLDAGQPEVRDELDARVGARTEQCIEHVACPTADREQLARRLALKTDSEILFEEATHLVQRPRPEDVAQDPGRSIRTKIIDRSPRGQQALLYRESEGRKGSSRC